MTRILFTGDDLARLRIQSRPGVLVETTLSLTPLQSRAGPTIFDGWRRRTRAAVGPVICPLVDLVAPPHLERPGGTPDFLFQTSGAGSMEQDLDGLLGLSAGELRQDLARANGVRTLPRWTRALADGDRDVRDLLAGAITAYHDVAVGPHWSLIQARIDAERAKLARIMADAGVEGLLRSLHPTIRWEPPFLHLTGDYWDNLPGGRVDHDLEGRGLILVPSFFTWPVTVFWWNRPAPTQPPMLIFPIEQDLLTLRDMWSPRQPTSSALASLLGRTRSAVMHAIADGRTTSELARALGISPASASEHATVLRSAKLISSQRYRNTVRHTLTPLGASLVDDHSGSPTT